MGAAEDDGCVGGFLLEGVSELVDAGDGPGEGGEPDGVGVEPQDGVLHPLHVVLVLVHECAVHDLDVVAGLLQGGGDVGWA
ncbi:hypothetical protein ES703_06794 [subsurface metagenome]